ncbi:MAG: PQQ-binding-like beta-propeller repeat protein [Candidatus Bathyarchaeota archaeon]|nr:PQQ-binding-like beta-propeller repeat protein [Candidatus Termiticorpusculum sp.]
MGTSKKILTFIIITILVSSSFTLLMAIQNNATAAPSDYLLNFEWPQFNGDSAFTRFSPGPAPSTPEVTWQADIANLHSYLAAFNGLVFAATDDLVFALNYDTGATVWSKEIPMKGTWPVAYKLDDTRMIVESTCIETATGNILWTSSDFCADTGNFNSNVYVSEEKMFYLKVDSFVEAWDFSDLSKPPTLAWTTYVPGGGRVGSGVTYGDGKIFPGSFQDQQIAIDAKTGKVLWTTFTKTAMIFFGSYADGKFVRGGTDDNTMYCFDANTGEVLWTYIADTSGYFCSGTAIGYGMVYSPNKDGYIYAINLANGELVWRYKGPGTMLFPGMPTVADGKVYVTSGQNASYGAESGSSQFACLDAFTGEAIWTLPIEAYAPRESVAIAYGYLYLIPGEVTEAVDSTSGDEYDLMGHIWAIASSETEPETDSWSMFRHDAGRSSIGERGPANLSLVWSFATGGAVMSSPSVVNGIVYFGSQDHNIYAVDAKYGKPIWTFSTNNTVESSVAVVDGKVVTGAEDGYVYCLDAYTGKLHWKTFVNGNQPVTYGAAVMIRSSPAIVDNMVYIGSLDGNLYALNFADGTIMWKYQTGGWIKSSPTISNGAVYITSETPDVGTIYKLNATTGVLIWKQTLPYEHQFTGGSDMIGTPTVADGKVFTSANLRTYYCLNDQNGNIIWNFTNTAANEFIVSSPIYLNGKVFVVDKFDITCLNASTGEKIWNTFTGDEYYVSPSYADGKIYIVTSERNIFIFDATTGEKLDWYILPSASWSSPTPYDGKLYIGSKDWNLYCLGEYNTDTMTVTLQTDKSQLKTGESLTLSGQLSPVLPSVNILLSFTNPDGNIQTSTVTTKPNGSYSYLYTPNIDGAYNVTATYQSKIPITSPTLTFTLNSLSTTPLPPTTITQIPNYLYAIVLVLAIALIVAVALLVLRRRQ